MSAPLSKKRLQRAKSHALQKQVALSEVFPETVADAGAVGFIFAQIFPKTAPVLWVQDRVSYKETGRPYLPGVGATHPIIQTQVNRPVDVLWAMEEGLRCTALSAVIGEIWGDPAALSFTATKRLAMRAEAANVACWLIRRAASPNLSAARERWRVASLPSTLHPHDPQAPGDPRWQAELFRSRTRKANTWVATYDPAADRIRFSAPFRDGAVAQNDGAHRQRAAR